MNYLQLRFYEPDPRLRIPVRNKPSSTEGDVIGYIRSDELILVESKPFRGYYRLIDQDKVI